MIERLILCFPFIGLHQFIGLWKCSWSSDKHAPHNVWHHQTPRDKLYYATFILQNEVNCITIIHPAIVRLLQINVLKVFSSWSAGMSNKLLRAAWKRGDCSRGHYMGEENHNYLLLINPNLSLVYIFCSSIFPQAHTNVNFTEKRFHFIQVKEKQWYTNS
jgi:hypothetical protein